MDLLCRGARFQCPSGMTVHRALGADGRRGAELDQLDDLLVQRAGMMRSRTPSTNVLGVLASRMTP